MLENAAIDVAIGLILMYLMLSLLCTVVNEFIASKANLRAKSLAAALEKLLDNDAVRADFYNHGLIVGAKRAVSTGTQSTMHAVVNIAKSLRAAVAAPAQAPVPAQKEDHPSYLSGRTVALALIASLDTNVPVPGIGQITAAVEALPQDSKLRSALLTSLTEAGGNMDVLRASIATWFDDSMDRLSGAYKRQLKWISMLIGLLVAVAFNADSFNVANTLWNDPERRASAVAIAKQVATEAIPAQGQSVDEKKLEESIKKTEKTLRALPIGWDCVLPKDVSAPDPKKITYYWDITYACTKANLPRIHLVQVLGWLLTAVALSLGAPFWFDLLNKFINLRGTGSKPQRQDGRAAAP